MVYYALDMAGENPQNYWQGEEDSQRPMPEAFANGEGDDFSPQPTPLLAQDTPENPPVTWEAQEYVHLDRSPMWFVIFVFVVLGLIAIDFLVLKSWTFSALVIVMAAALVIYIRRPPRVLTYALSPAQGLYVSERLYRFDEFKTFGLIKDGPHFSILLIPRKRFAAGVSVFFPEELGERIVDILGQQLPMENLQLDIVDVIVRKLHL